MILLLADSSLDPSEKEDQAAHDILHKRPPHSRKYTERRGPKHDNRKNRIQEDDPDMGGCTVEKDRDMSLNYKNIGGSTKTAVAPAPLPGMMKDEDPGPSEEKTKDTKKVSKESYEVEYEKLKKRLKSISPALVSNLDEATRFQAFSNLSFKDKIDDLNKTNGFLTERIAKHKEAILKSDDPIAYAEKNWPSNTGSWVDRASLIGAVKWAKENFKLDKAVKAVLDRDDMSSVVEDRELIKQIVKGESGKEPIDQDKINKYARLTALSKEIKNNPKQIGDISKDVDALSKNMADESSKLVELNNILKTWRSTVSNLKSPDTDDLKHGTDLKKAMHSLRSFFGIGGERKMKIVHPTIFMDEIIKDFKDRHGEVPAELKALSSEAAKEYGEPEESKEKSKEASNRISGYRNMATRLAEYHGVKDTKGNPTDPPNTPYNSYDKRYFDEEHWKSVIKHANELLQDDWFKYGWAGSPKDSQLRAALDVAVHLSDNNLYQGKIDSNTYNMLLNRLGEWGYDQFSETILPFTKVKKASNLQKVAGSRQQEELKMESQVHSLRSLISTGADMGMVPQEQSAADEPGKSAEGAEGKELADALKKVFAEFGIEDKPLEGFMDKAKKGELSKIIDRIKKVFASSRIAAEGGETEKLFKDFQAEMNKIEQLAEIPEADLNDIIDEEATKFDDAVDAGDMAKMIEALKDMNSKAKKPEKKAPGASTELASLIKVAHANPSTRAVLLPIIKARLAAEEGEKKESEGEVTAEQVVANLKEMYAEVEMNDFVNGFGDIDKLISRMRQGSTHIAAVDAGTLKFDTNKIEQNLSDLVNLSEEDAKKLIEDRKTQDQFEKFQEALKSKKGVDEIMQQLDGLIDAMHDLTESKPKTTTGSDNLSALIKIAFNNPSIRQTLMPVIVAAAKKKMKKAPKKDSKKGKKGPSKGKKPPFGGKKAPPFGKGKKAPSKGKKAPPSVKVDAPWMKEPPAKQASKSTTQIGSDDFDW